MNKNNFYDEIIQKSPSKNPIFDFEIFGKKKLKTQIIFFLKMLGFWATK